MKLSIIYGTRYRVPRITLHSLPTADLVWSCWDSGAETTTSAKYADARNESPARVTISGSQRQINYLDSGLRHVKSTHLELLPEGKLPPGMQWKMPVTSPKTSLCGHKR